MEEEPIPKNHKQIYLLVSCVLLITGVATLLFFLVQGRTVTTHSTGNNESNVSIVCTTSNLTYPFFDYDEASKKETVVNAIFSDDEKLSSISITQTMHYPNKNTASKSETINHASMNKSFGATLGADALNANYYTSNNSMRMQLYANSSQYTEETKKYFLANNASDTADSLLKVFEQQGFSCTKKDN